MGRTIYLELVAGSRVATDLGVGGLFVMDKLLVLHEVCEIVVFNDGGQLELPAKCVYVDGNGGVGLELVGFGEATKSQLAALIEAGVAAASLEPPEAIAPAEAIEAAPPVEATAPGDEDDGLLTLAPEEPAASSEPPPIAIEADDDDDEKQTLHERIRNLPLVEQIKLAKKGGVTERILLERTYGKNVWEPLLRNPGLTAPEVARIARMGALPRPLLEIILGNGAWLQVPEVRRALLSNPRLGTDHILKLLRMMTKQELKLTTMQTAYSMAVRSQAKALLKQEGG